MKKLDLTAIRKGGERGSCCVHTLANVFDLTYENANGIAAQFGRKQNAGMYRNEWLPMLKAVAKKKRRTIVKLDKAEWPGKTVKTFSKNAGHGRYIVGTSGHLLAVVNGEAKDWTSGRQHRVTGVWMVI